MGKKWFIGCLGVFLRILCWNWRFLILAYFCDSLFQVVRFFENLLSFFCELPEVDWIVSRIALYAKKILIEMFLKLLSFDKWRMRLHPSRDTFPVSIPMSLLTKIYFSIPFKRRMSSKTLQLWVVIDKMLGVLTKYRLFAVDLLLTSFDMHLTQRSEKVGDSLFFVC